MAYRLMILPIALMMIVSCGSISGLQSNSGVDLKKLDLSLIAVDEKTLLMFAAEQGNSNLLREAFEQGDMLNSVSSEGTAFSLALKNGHKTVGRILLSAGSEWTVGFESDQSSALIYAADQGFDKLVKMLIVRGADLEYLNKKGYSALARAAINGHLTTLKILLNAGAKVDLAPEGRSVLMHVVEDNNMLLSQLLIAAGADLDYTDEYGDTALIIARRKGYFDLDLMLVQAGARP
jgi:ankyrin repeat protein